VDKFKESILDLFFPKFCLGCKKEGSYLCDDCRALLDINEFNYCLCDKPLRIPHTQLTGKCSRCSEKSLSGLYFALPYKENPLTKKLIYQFKYQPYLKDLAKTLASILIEHFILSGKNTDDIWKNSILIPVPLSKDKFKERGYNQSEELSKELSKVLQIPVILNNLIKTKSTKAQAESTKSEREKNLQGGFIVKNPSAIAQGRVFLVDDVYTTGSTLNECAKILKESGVKQVWGVTMAREE